MFPGWRDDGLVAPGNRDARLSQSLIRSCQGEDWSRHRQRVGLSDGEHDSVGLEVEAVAVNSL